MSLTKIKAETESRMQQEKKALERKRNIIILINKYLLSVGYIDAVTKIEQQSNLSLEKWDTADNIDLLLVVAEFEMFYEMRFGKPPKLTKKVDHNQSYEIMKKNALNRKQVNSSINKQHSKDKDKDSKDTKQNNQTNIPPKPNFKKKELGEKAMNQTSKSESIEIQGNAVNKKKQDQEEDFFDVRLQKGIPDYSDVPQFKELATYLQRDICIQNPNVKFTDIVGLDDAKRLLKEAVMLPLKYPYLFTGILEPWRGVLLFGPPGTGKTMLAKAVATECKTTFFNISASSVVSKWRGQSQKLIRCLFEMARHYQPSTIFLDELDSIMSQRTGSDTEHQGSRRMKTQLLIQMDGLMKNRERVFVLAASNLPWDLDVAMLRRLEKRILVPLPCLQAREAMIKMYLPLQMTEQFKYEQYSRLTEGYSGSDIKLLCKEAAMKPLRRLLNELQSIEVREQGKKKVYGVKQKEEQVKPGATTNKDMGEALSTTKASPGLNTLKYQKWVQNYGSL